MVGVKVYSSASSLTWPGLPVWAPLCESTRHPADSPRGQTQQTSTKTETTNNAGAQKATSSVAQIGNSMFLSLVGGRPRNLVGEVDTWTVDNCKTSVTSKLPLLLGQQCSHISALSWLATQNENFCFFLSRFFLDLNSMPGRHDICLKSVTTAIFWKTLAKFSHHRRCRQVSTLMPGLVN